MLEACVRCPLHLAVMEAQAIESVNPTYIKESKTDVSVIRAQKLPALSCCGNLPYWANIIYF